MPCSVPTRRRSSARGLRQLLTTGPLVIETEVAHDDVGFIDEDAGAACAGDSIGTRGSTLQ